jgi:hypothetical protein
MLQIKNTRDLLSPEEFKMKCLIYGPGGVGKTRWAAGAPNAIIAAAETGHGGGTLSIAKLGIDYVTPKTYDDLEAFCSGVGLESYDTLILDGMSYQTDTVIKDYALTVKRKTGDTAKRAMGVPEMDDYGTMAELERRLLAKILQLPKHIIVTCLMDYYQPAQDAQGGNPPKPEKIGGPDLPGQMRMGSTAMFDLVLRLWTRSAMRSDKVTRYIQRYFLTENDSKYLAKARLANGSKQLYPTEVIFDLDSGMGTFDWFYREALKTFSGGSDDLASTVAV